MIVIHAVVDIGNFIFPYLLNIKDTLYLSTLDPATHKTVIELFVQNFPVSGSLLIKLSLFFVYMQNIIALFFLLFIPFYMWIRIVNKKKIAFRKFQVAIFFSSLLCFIFAPIFKVSALKDAALVGADISTRLLTNGWNLKIVALTSILWFFIVYMLGSVGSIKKWLDRIVVFSSIFFLGQYIYYFYSSSLIFYITNIRFLFSNSKILLALYLMAYLLVITLFYIAGFILFASEVATSEHFSFIRLKMRLQKKIIFLWSVLLFLGFIYLLNTGKMFEQMSHYKPKTPTMH